MSKIKTIKAFNADMHVHDYEYACSRLRICMFTIADMRVHKRPYQLCVLCGSAPLR